MDGSTFILNKRFVLPIIYILLLFSHFKKGCE